jgi:hypothetical protein
MPFQVACTGCGHTLSVKDEWEGKRLKCPKCATTFPASRAAAKKPRPRVQDAEEEVKPSRFELPFTLGPDDRYPRLLYWGLLLYLIFDAVFAVPMLLPVLHEKPNTDYHGERLIGWGLAIVIPPAIGVAIVLAFSLSALIYAVYKLLLAGVVLTSALGSSMIGESAKHGSVSLQTAWHVLGIVLGVWYFFARRE